MNPVVPIVKEVKGKYQIKFDVLEQILTQPDLKDTLVAIASITGAAGNGKSFLLNLFKRIFDASGSQVDLEECSNIVQHFKTACGIKSSTCGVWMTTEPRILHREDKKIAVFLLDTQGLDTFEFGINRDCVIYAISNMMSSVQIINCNKIDPKLINQLAVFSRKKKLWHALGPQYILMLVRNWERPNTIACGLDAERRYFTELGTGGSQAMKELSDVYGQLECFLMPHPGEEVATTNTSNFDDINKEAKTSIDQLYQHLFSSSNVIVKKIGGVEVTCGELFAAIKDVSLDNCNNITVENLLEGYQRRFAMDKIEESVQIYKESMWSQIMDDVVEESMGDGTQQKNIEGEPQQIELAVPEDRLEAAHKLATEKAVENFEDEIPEQDVRKFRCELDQRIKKEYLRFKGNKIKSDFFEKWDRCVDNFLATSLEEADTIYKTIGDEMLNELWHEIEDVEIFTEIKREALDELKKLRQKELLRRLENRKRLNTAAVAGAATVVLTIPAGIGMVAGGAALAAPVGFAAVAAATAARTVPAVIGAASLTAAGGTLSSAVGYTAGGGRSALPEKYRNAPELDDQHAQH